VRVATYNVRNLFTAAEAELRGLEPRSEAELKALAGTVRVVGADVLLLQEVGSLEALEDLNGRLDNPYPFADVLPTNSARGIHLAVLSREPFELASHREVLLQDEEGAPLFEYDSEADAVADRAQPLRFQRDLMLAEIDLGMDEPLAVFNVHLKSKTNRPWRALAADVVRSAESRAMARIVADHLQTHPDRVVLLAGDFNDTRRSEALSPIFELPIVDPLGATLAATNRNPSTYWPKRRMRLDFVLCAERAGHLVQPGTAKIHRSERARRASDHYPVSLDLDL
jgi:endonuclease/exonuclease/phosphatase family metal-dependent hydrolase